MLTSLPVWAIIAAHFGTNWCIYVMFTELPIFLTQSLGYRVDQVRSQQDCGTFNEFHFTLQAGGLAALPWLPLAITVYGAGLVSDRLAQHHSTGYVRKLIMGICKSTRVTECESTGSM